MTANKPSDLRSNLGPRIEPNKNRLNWLDPNGNLLQPDLTDDKSDHKAGHKSQNKPDQALRQPEVAPEKLRKHAT